MKDIKYYNILEISKDANIEEIKKAYRRLALKWHPDKNKNSEESKKKMQEIGEAYEKLNDEGIRKFEYNSNYYDYEVPKEGALIKETLKDLDESYYVLRTFYVGEYDNKTGKHKRSGETAVNDYDLERGKRILQLLSTVSELNKEGRNFESSYGEH
jgi:DnaJ-class molecular chaperone